MFTMKIYTHGTSYKIGEKNEPKINFYFTYIALHGRAVGMWDSNANIHILNDNQ